MSFGHPADYIKNAPYQDATTILVLVVMGQGADEESGLLWHKVSTLAKNCRLSQRRTREILARLIDDCFVERQPRYHVDGSQRSNMWRMFTTAEAARRRDGEVIPLPFDAEEEVRPTAVGGAAHRRGGVRPTAGGDAAHRTPKKDQEKDQREYLGVPLETSGEVICNTAAAYAHTHTHAPTRETAAAAAVWSEDALRQKAERIRHLLRMNRDKIEGITLTLRLYRPDEWPWIENETNLCFETLKVRPLGLNHFSNWLQDAKKRLLAEREASTNGKQQSQQQSSAAADATERRPAAMDEEEYRRRMDEVVQRAWENAQRGGASAVSGVQRDDE